MFYDRLFGPNLPPPFPDYSTYPKLKTYKEVKTYYDEHWDKIIYEKARSHYGSYSLTYDEFVARLEYEPARSYVSPSALARDKSPEAAKFESLTRVEDVSTRTHLGSGLYKLITEKERYEIYWDHPEGMEIARRITPKLPAKGSSLALKHEQIVAQLRKYLQPYTPAVAAWTLAQASVPQMPMSVDDMKYYSDLMRVRFMERWYLGSIVLQLQNWWYGLKIRRFEIMDWETIDKVGDMYLVKGARAETLPLAPKGRVLVTSPDDFNLIHESVHAAQFSFVYFWEIPREHVEIPAMFVEKIAREDKRCSIDGKHMARQAALAIADLTTESPDDFNKVYEELMGVTGVGHLRARMPQLANCPQAYYGYVLGLTCERSNASKIHVAVRDPSKILELVSLL